MTKYVIAPDGVYGFSSGDVYRVIFNGRREPSIVNDIGRCDTSSWAQWPATIIAKSDVELLAELRERNPNWDLPLPPDRQEEVMSEWLKEWNGRDLGMSTKTADFAFWLAKKLLSEGVIQ